MHLYSKISFGLGRLGQAGPQAVLAGLASVFWTLSWPDPGPEPFPFLFFSRWPIQLSGQNPDQNRFPFPFFIFNNFRGGEGEGGPRGRAQRGTHPHLRFERLKTGLLGAPKGIPRYTRPRGAILTFLEKVRFGAPKEISRDTRLRDANLAFLRKSQTRRPKGHFSVDEAQKGKSDFSEKSQIRTSK